jgi:hypothetical protein
MFRPLSELASVSLGYKSLQNEFFYVNQATIDSFGIEAEYLQPILKLANMHPRSYYQDPLPTLWLFHCTAREADLRGTGALRYISAMSERLATQRKQSGKPQTVRQALSAQGGGLWYAPKAQPHQHHIWLRKGISGVFSPFLFKQAALVDQRCNGIAPKHGVSWTELAAILGSTLFSYAVEVNGSTAMGAGVLEASTTKLKDYPAFDVTALDMQARKVLVKLADAALQEQPVDWSGSAVSVGKGLRALDQWMLTHAGSAVTVDTLYADMEAACKTRLLLASDKVKVTKSKKSSNIRAVAEGIAARVRSRLQLKNFPEDFLDNADLDISVNIAPELIRSISFTPMLGDTELIIADGAGRSLLEGQYPSAVGEAVVRALLWGRASFRLSSDRKAAHDAVEAFLRWFRDAETEIAKGVSNSALGTGYEEILHQEVFRALGIDARAVASVLPQEITFSAQK